jgi:class 3 adenylate cyclase/tetratricopeptide (TPR) repeat protein
MAAVCPSCRSANADGAKFCSECGARLAAAPMRVEERKVVTVVFCDLVGSTARAERLDPEDVRAELSSFHSRVRAELERRGGTVEKFIGDAVVAVFGAPAVHEDDPERAVRAALAIRDWAVDDGEVDVRLAVNTGEALVSIGARPETGEGLVAGDVINTAARLQSAAPVNGILVGEATQRATSRAIEYRPHDPVEAKGKQHAVPVWEAIAARSLFGVDVELRPRTRLVGRLRELDQLLGALARARAEREPQLMTIVGVPGMGKSRLVQELSVALEQEPELVRWRQGRSLPYGQGVSYWALGEMVKAEAGILESDRGDVAETKLREMVARVSPADAEWIQSLLRPLIGVAEDGAGADRRSEAFAAWRRFVEALADERPTVLVFEDLHWADDGLLDFLDGLVDWATDVPLLVVATARPELLSRRPHWGGGKPNAITLSLAPLSEAETAELVHAVLERAVLPADLQHAVLSRAGGNPLYAEEFARLVAERGGAGGGDLPVPDSLQGLISARLDALSRTEKELIQVAAVAGKVFWRGALVGESRGPGEVDEALRALERKEFVRRDRRSSMEGEEQYAFRHVLVRDVAYAQIPRAARGERHRRVAAWIESQVRAEDAAELLAHHYVSALEYARAVGGEVEELELRARAALREAGRRAVALNAFTNATRFYEQALALTPEDDPEWPRLALEHAEVTPYVDVSGDRYLVRARAALLAGDVDDAARAELVLGEYRWLRGDRASAAEHFTAAEQLAARMTGREARLRVVANLARFLMLADEYDRSIRLARQALELAEELGDDSMRSHALNSLGLARVSLGDVGGLADVEESCELSRRAGGPEYLRATGNLASVLVNLGQLERALELHRDALAIAREIGYEEPTRWLSTEIAIDEEVAGDWPAARAMVDELIPGYAESPFWIEPQTRTCRARMLIAEGDVAGAVADADRAVERAREGRSFQSLADPAAFRARLHAELGEIEHARRIADELFAAWGETGSSYLGLWVLELWYAGWRTGEEPRLAAMTDALPPNAWLAAAQALLRRDFAAAASDLDEMGAASCAALARLWGSEWLVENGRQPEAAGLLDASLAFWRRVGASAYTRRGESLLAAAS